MAFIYLFCFCVLAGSVRNDAHDGELRALEVTSINSFFHQGKTRNSSTHSAINYALESASIHSVVDQGKTQNSSTELAVDAALEVKLSDSSMGTGKKLHSTTELAVDEDLHLKDRAAANSTGGVAGGTNSSANAAFVGAGLVADDAGPPEPHFPARQSKRMKNFEIIPDGSHWVQTMYLTTTLKIVTMFVAEGTDGPYRGEAPSGARLVTYLTDAARRDLKRELEATRKSIQWDETLCLDPTTFQIVSMFVAHCTDGRTWNPVHEAPSGAGMVTELTDAAREALEPKLRELTRELEAKMDTKQMRKSIIQKWKKKAYKEFCV